MLSSISRPARVLPSALDDPVKSDTANCCCAITKLFGNGWRRAKTWRNDKEEWTQFYATDTIVSSGADFLEDWSGRHLQEV